VKVGASIFSAGPDQAAMYLGYWLDGSTRNLTREQVLMMGGQEIADGPPPADADHEVPF
jgi:hypothetical protein